MTLAAALAFLVVVRVWTRRGPPRVLLITGPLTAVLLVLLSGLSPAAAGLTLSGFGYAVSGAIVVLLGYGCALLIPAARRALAAPGFERPWFTALIAVPLSTVVFEEAAFRGVLWELIARDHGTAWAVGVTAVLFGLWHISPDTGIGAQVGTVAFTTLAGVVLALLRDVSGGLAAPIAVHWAANGLGVLASTLVRARSCDGPEEPMTAG